MNIGEASKASSVSAKMIRYYESVGLVRGIQRTEAGYRDFDESDVALLSFIRRARDLGMPVARIAQLLDVMARGEDVRPILSAHADDLRRKIDEVAEKHGVVRELRSGKTPGVGLVSWGSSQVSNAITSAVAGSPNPVHSATGAKILDGEDDLDFTLPGLLPIEWQRYYSSRDERQRAAADREHRWALQVV